MLPREPNEPRPEWLNDRQRRRFVPRRVDESTPAALERIRQRNLYPMYLRRRGPEPPKVEKKRMRDSPSLVPKLDLDKVIRADEEANSKHEGPLSSIRDYAVAKTESGTYNITPRPRYTPRPPSHSSRRGNYSRTGYSSYAMLPPIGGPDSYAAALQGADPFFFFLP